MRFICLIFILFISALRPVSADICIDVSGTDAVDGQLVCQPRDCTAISAANEAAKTQGTALNSYLAETQQTVLFAEAGRKCSFRSAGKTVNGVIDRGIDTGKSLLDKSGISDFFKGLTGK